MAAPPPFCRLYLISPPAIDLPVFKQQLASALSGGDIASFQLRLKDASDGDILKAAEALMPICHAHDAAFIVNDRPDLAVQCGADGVHIGQEDLTPSPAGGGSGWGHHWLGRCKNAPLPTSPLRGEETMRIVRTLIGPDRVIGVSCHDSRHLAMVAGEEGADYVAFGAFYPTKSKSAENLARYGTPKPEILTWWSENTVLPCVAIGGITPGNCAPLVKAGADFIAAITAVWEHPEGPKKAVEEFNEVIQKHIDYDYNPLERR